MFVWFYCWCLVAGHYTYSSLIMYHIVKFHLKQMIFHQISGKEYQTVPFDMYMQYFTKPDERHIKQFYVICTFVI